MTSKNILFQDNQSAIKMEKNGKKLCTGKSRHIDTQGSFVNYWVDSNNIMISHYNIEHVIADFFTKYLQGYLFVKFPDVIMGWKHIDMLQMGPTSIKERVGNVDEFNSIIKAKKRYSK